MRIALIAQDKKKEQMIRFCLTYAKTLSQHKLFATGTTGKMISEHIGLPVYCFLTGRQGGEQQISERIACGEIDMLLFFRDTLTSRPRARYEDMLRLCDTHGVVYATNFYTAKALMYALEHNQID